MVGYQGETNYNLQRILAIEFLDSLWAFDQSVLNKAVFWLLFPGTFVSHGLASAVAFFVVGEAAIRCLEIHADICGIIFAAF